MVRSSSWCRLVVLISGNGTNLQAIIDACLSRTIQATVVGVISNEPDAYGLIRARNKGIPTCVIDHRIFDGRKNFDTELEKTIDRFGPDLIILAGFMRILGSKIVEHYVGRMLNIHPSLLPSYPGLDTHARALSDGAREHGATVHFVTPELDAGPIILQKRIRVEIGDTEQTLAERVHQGEYEIYPQAIKWFAEGRLTLDKSRVYLDGSQIDTWSSS